MRMNIELKRTLAAITFLFATITSSTHVPAEEAVPALLNVKTCARLGLTYTVSDLGTWNASINVQQTTPGLGCAVAGMEPGDQIWRINNQRVRTAAELQHLVAVSPNRARIKIKDIRTGQFQNRWVQVSQFVASPPAPLPPVPGGPDLTGLWRSSLSGTMRFTPTPRGFAGKSIVPFVGSSNMTCVKLNDGSYQFKYTNYSGVRDSGDGTLKFVGWNRIQGSVTSSSGIRANFILTR